MPYTKVVHQMKSDCYLKKYKYIKKKAKMLLLKTKKLQGLTIQKND